jgi:membrane-associated progesterone receptor component
MSEKSDSFHETDDSSESAFSTLSTYFINFVLLGIIFYLIYKIFRSRTESDKPAVGPPPLPPMKKRDFTLDELKEFDGEKGEGRVLIAVNGNVFDVTRGKTFYGPGGPYAVFAGRDASRGLATFSFDLKEEYDDLSDLKPHEMDSIIEWEMQFKEKYDYVGKLLKPGEVHNSYSDDESESTSVTGKSKKDD